MPLLSLKHVLGQDCGHLACFPGSSQQVHREILAPLTALQNDAEQAGFTLTIASGFRSFERQLAIWNGKVAGQRPVLDSQGQVLDLRTLPSDWARVQAILRWSALPGCSRHHWGTDLDVYDQRAMPPDYQLQLTVAEARSVFAEFHRWLDEAISSHQSHQFYRPYHRDRGGVAPEPWHISFRPLAQACAQRADRDTLYQVLAQTELGLRDTVLAHWDDIYERFVLPGSDL